MEIVRTGVRQCAWLTMIAFILLGLATPGRCGFIGQYGPDKFNLLNDNADGFVTTDAGGLFLELTGGNSGSGLEGTIDLTIAAAAAGIVEFAYTYATLDIPDSDFAGYLLGGVYHQLANQDGLSGNVSFPVTAGQIFGWRVITVDNLWEPGILTVSNFSAPESSTGVPEPGTLSIVLLGAALFIALRPRLRGVTVAEEHQK